MPLITYVPKRFQAETMAIIDQAVEICEEYAAMGYELTLRRSTTSSWRTTCCPTPTGPTSAWARYLVADPPPYRDPAQQA